MAGFHASWTEILNFFELPTLVFCSFLNNVEIIVNKICFWKEKCPRSLNPSKAIAMAICPIIVHFGTWRARSMHDVACEFARSKDAQKQLARTSLNLQLLKLRLQPRWSHLNFICISAVQSTSIHSSFGNIIIFIFSNSTFKWDDVNRIKSEDVNLERGHGQQRMWKYAGAVCLKPQHKVEALLARFLPVDVLTLHHTLHHQGNRGLHPEVSWPHRGMRQSVSHLLPVNRIYKVNLCGEGMNVFTLHIG